MTTRTERFFCRRLTQMNADSEKKENPGEENDYKKL